MAHIAIDLGNTSGRISLATFSVDRLQIAEVHRFANRSLRTDDRLEWDLAHLLEQVKQGIRLALTQNPAVESIGIDSWGVDFALIDRNGTLLANPLHHRTASLRAAQASVHARIPPAELFARTGTQDLPINSLYHLVDIQTSRPELLEQAETMLMMADIVRFRLSGDRTSEFTLATTSQLIDPQTSDWNLALATELGLPARIFPRLIHAGMQRGTLTSAIAIELSAPPIPVVAVAQHDTASAVFATPGPDDAAWLSMGTWGLLGTGVDTPVLTDAARLGHLTNEGGAVANTRLLRNLTGMWLYERCRADLAGAGHALSHADILAATNAEPIGRHLFDPDHPSLVDPINLPQAIADLVGQTHLSTAALFRSITDSLALKVAMVLGDIERASIRRFPGLHLVGGGARNQPLAQAIANALGRPVWTGPVEATTIGNVLMQIQALGAPMSTANRHHLIRSSFPIETVLPGDGPVWAELRRRFVDCVYDRSADG
ncbi:MAG TPA: FGGY family carbohydrate kinase [Thermomicrobiales bacterium]|nr:FGGY family carbohydrate kinase [Thermomicrobiales bacterium]